MNTKIIICPGIHSPQLTDSFIQSLTGFNNSNLSQDYLIFPTIKYPAYSAIHIIEFLQETQAKPSQSQPLIFIAFSAGVVGGIGAANLWQLWGGKVRVFIAVDGWGVPLIANFPIHRVSHDYFTHWSCSLIGTGSKNFYAQPAVTHLDLWRSPHNVWGWEGKALGLKIYTSATKFIESLIL